MKRSIILAVLLTGCTAASRAVAVSPNNNDVLILSMLVQDLLREKDSRSITLAELIQRDTSGRISSSFQRVTLKYKGGHISVYFKFAESRNPSAIELTDKEKARTKFTRWKEKNLRDNYDGEIQLDYGERFYRMIKIVRNKATNSEIS